MEIRELVSSLQTKISIKMQEFAKTEKEQQHAKAEIYHELKALQHLIQEHYAFIKTVGETNVMPLKEIKDIHIEQKD